MFLLLYIYCGRTHGLLTNVDHLVLAYWLPTFLMKVEALLWQSEGNSDQAPFKDWFRFSYGDSITRLTELNSHFYQPSSQFIGMVWGLLSSHSHPIWTLMCFLLLPFLAPASICFGSAVFVCTLDGVYFYLIPSRGIIWTLFIMCCVFTMSCCVATAEILPEEELTTKLSSPFVMWCVSDRGNSPASHQSFQSKVLISGYSHNTKWINTKPKMVTWPKQKEGNVSSQWDYMDTWLDTDITLTVKYCSEKYEGWCIHFQQIFYFLI